MVASKSDSEITELQARLTELEAVNAELSAKLKTTAASGVTRAPRWRGALAAFLIILGTLLTPASITAGWARIVLTDTDAFVATYGPLVSDPQVQLYLTDQIVAAIDQKIDIDATVGEVIDGLKQSIQRPRVQSALDLLRQPAADGVRSTIRGVAAKVIASDEFAQVWRESLRLSHSQAIAALSGDPESSVTITAEGLGLRLAPLIVKVRETLTNQGFAFAAQIPAIDKTILIAPMESLTQVQLAYRGVLATGYWLGAVVLALMASAVVVSRNRWRTTLWVAFGLGLGALSVLGGVGVGRVVAQASVPASVMPNEILVLFFDTVSAGVNELATATLLMAVVVALIAWLGGPFQSSIKLRAAYASLTQGLRERAESHGFTSGRFGEWLATQRTLVRVAVGVLAALVLVLNRPISAGLVLTTAIIAGIVLVVISLLERPSPVEPDSPPPPD